jgi:large subunit ribosomal protein L25
MSELVLEAVSRDGLKKEASKRYRREGLIPSVVYGQGKNTNILIKSQAFRKMYPKLTKSTIISLKMDNSNYDVLIKDYDKNYIKDEFIHLDFYQLDAKKPVKLTIPLEFVGNAIGIREGGLLEKHLVNLEVSCLPKDIVHNFEINVDNLKINESLHVKDLKIDSKYKIISHLDEVVVKISIGLKEEVIATTAETTVVAAAAATTVATEKATQESDEKK